MAMFESTDRTWYYRNAIQAFKALIVAYGLKSKDKVYIDCLLHAAEHNPEIAIEVIDFGSDRIRFVNHKHDKNGKVISCDVVLTDRNS